MNLKLIVAILVIATVPVCAQAQNPSAAKLTRADVQKVVKLSAATRLRPGPFAISANSVSRSRMPMRKGMGKRPMSCLRK